MQEAKANLSKVEADYRAAANSVRGRGEAREPKQLAEYKVAKESCDALSGNAKGACVSNADARHAR